MTIRTPRLREGRYNLATIACRPQFDQTEGSLAETLAVFTVDKPSFRTPIVNAGLAVLHQQLQLNALLELMAQSYLREDGSGISRILDTLERELILLGALPEAQELANIRVNFLHRGSFALPQLNDSWRIVYRASQTFFSGV